MRSIAYITFLVSISALTAGDWGWNGGLHGGSRLRSKKLKGIHRTARIRPHWYRFQLENGSYSVAIETLVSTTNNGRFSIEANGRRVLDALPVTNPNRSKKAELQVRRESFDCDVADGLLTLYFPATDSGRSFALCSIEITSTGGKVLRVNCGGPAIDDWQADQMWKGAAPVIALKPRPDGKGKWIKISDEITQKLKTAQIEPVPRWSVDYRGSGFTAMIADRGGNTFVNIAGQGLWRYGGPGSTLERVDGYRWFSNICCHGGDKPGNMRQGQGRYIQYSLNPNGPGFYIFGWNAFSKATAQLFSPEGKTFYNFTDSFPDYGTVAWNAGETKLVLTKRHHTYGQVDLSVDGGKTFTKFFDDGFRLKAIGAIAPNILLKCLTRTFPNKKARERIDHPDDAKLVGIHRSTDLGRTWHNVCGIDIGEWTGSMVYHKGEAFFNSTQGLLVSTDEGATWQVIPNSPAFCQPVLVGGEDAHLIGFTRDACYESRDHGRSWSQVATAPEKTGYFAYDPVKDVFYAGAYNGDWYRFERGLSTEE